LILELQHSFTEKVDLPSHHIAVKNFLLENTNVVIVPSKRNENKIENSSAVVSPWVISLNHLILNGDRFQYGLQGTAGTKGFDLNHLGLEGLAIRAENLYYSRNRMRADISHISFREHSGLELRELSGGFLFDSLHAQLTDFTVETSTSRIQQNIHLNYSSLSALKTSLVL